MKVKVENFQSIEKAEIEIKGFTTIVGRSNIGKSAIVRAIEGALTNKTGDHYVRTGASHTEVTIESSEINLNWKKGSGYNDYIINGELLTSVGRGAPPHIAEAGFRDIEVSNKKLNVQIAGQFNPIFLIDPSQVSGAVAAEVISDIGRLSEVQTAFRQSVKDRKSKEGFIRVREKDLIKVRESLEKFDKIEEHQNLVESLKTLHGEIVKAKAEIESLERLQGVVEECQDVILKNYGMDTLEIPTVETPEFNIIQNLEAFQRHLIESLTVTEKLDGVETIEVPTEEFENEFKALRAYSEFHRHVKTTLIDVNKFSGADAIEVPEKLEPNMIQGIFDLEELMRQTTMLESRIPEIEADLVKLENEYKDTQAQVQHILIEAGSCPTCGVLCKETHD